MIMMVGVLEVHLTRSSCRVSVLLSSSFAMADGIQTDVSRPSALPTAKLRPTAAQAQSIVDQNSDEYLDAIEEEWNKKIDVEIDTLVDGMVDIVNLASVCCPYNSCSDRHAEIPSRLEIKTNLKSHRNPFKRNAALSQWFALPTRSFP